MKKDYGQQLIRILLYMAGGYVLGDGVVENSEFQMAAGALTNLAVFGWWYFWNSRRA